MSFNFITYFLGHNIKFLLGLFFIFFHSNSKNFLTITGRSSSIAKISGLRIDLNDIKNMVSDKKILYDHFADQKKIHRWDSAVVLKPIDISYLPEYIVNNKEKFKEWLEL